MFTWSTFFQNVGKNGICLINLYFFKGVSRALCLPGVRKNQRSVQDFIGRCRSTAAPTLSHPVDPSEASVSVYGHSGDRCSENGSRVRLHAASGGGGGAAGGNVNRLHGYFTFVLFLMFF